MSINEGAQKGNLNMGKAAGCRGGDIRELELAEEVVVLGRRMLTPKDLDEDGGLVVSSS